jgi:dienelactone hydrolase
VGGGDHQVNFYDDTDVPLLVLLGGADDESPPESCIQQARKNAAKGLPVSWKVYQDATHGFDFSHLGTRTLLERRGSRTVTFRYDAKAVEQALRDSREFLSLHSASRKE